MKKFNLLASAALSLTLLFTACSVEKRHYTKGYNVNWNKSAPKAEVQSAQNNAKPIDVKQVETPQAGEVAQNTAATTTLSNNTTTVADVNTPKATKTAPVTTGNTSVTKKEHSQAPKVQTPKMMVVKMAKGITNKMGGGKSQLIALLLVIFVGVLGIHRMYLGYWGIGVIQLLTGGGCGVWALIDLIRIITGDLGPKDGSYSETL